MSIQLMSIKNQAAAPHRDLKTSQFNSNHGDVKNSAVNWDELGGLQLINRTNFSQSNWRLCEDSRHWRQMEDVVVFFKSQRTVVSPLLLIRLWWNPTQVNFLSLILLLVVVVAVGKQLIFFSMGTSEESLTLKRLYNNKGSCRFMWTCSNRIQEIKWTLWKIYPGNPSRILTEKKPSEKPNVASIVASGINHLGKNRIRQAQQEYLHS